VIKICLPRPVTNWLCVVGGLSILLIVVGFFSLPVAIGLAWSFPHAETSIGWWTRIGVSLPLAIVIASVCATFATYGWFYLTYETKILDSLASRMNNDTGRKSWYYRLAREVPYIAVPVCSFGPDGGVFVSAGLCRILGLNIYTGVALTTIGNILKNVAWGFGFSSSRTRYITWGFAVVLALIAILKIVKSKPHKNLNIKTLKNLLTS